MKSLDKIKSELEAAWSARMEFRWDASLLLLKQLENASQISTAYQSPDAIKHAIQHGASPKEAAELFCLRASLDRALGEVESADLVLEILESQVRVGALAPFFSLAQEVGRVAFLKGEFTKALDAYLQAQVLATTDTQRLTAVGNILFCLEQLGISYQQKKIEVTELLEKLSKVKPFPRAAAQLHALDMRERFREGSIGSALALVASPERAVFDQSAYYSLWIRMLPYHSSFSEQQQKMIEHFAGKTAEMHYRNYRMRTLQGRLHPEDKNVLKPSEWADRLYLWVWKWLANPKDFSAERIWELLADVDLHQLRHRFTNEDRQITRNAILWLGLFDPTSQQKVDKLVAVLEGGSQEDHPIFYFEALAIRYLIAKRSHKHILRDDYLALLKQHPLWVHHELYFTKLILLDESQDVPPWLVTMIRNLKSMTESASCADGLLVIDLNTQIVSDKRTGMNTVSKPICAALDLARRLKSVSCEQLTLSCFGIRYDSFLHDSKIHNLIARMKKLTANKLQFRLKQGYLLSEGDWTSIQFIESTTAIMQTEFGATWAAFLDSSPLQAKNQSKNLTLTDLPKPKMDHVRADWIPVSGISRQELEEKMARPRSTTNRIIQKLIDEGKLIRKGQSRGTRYFLSQKSHQLSHEGRRPFQ